MTSTQTSRAIHAYRQAEASLQLARTNLRTAVLEELSAGVTQAELVRATGLTRESLRRIARTAGYPPVRHMPSSDGH